MVTASNGQASPQFRPSTNLAHTPAAFWTGLAIGVVGLFVHFSSTKIVLDSSGYSCSYHEYSSWIFAALVLVCGCAGWLGRQSVHVARRLAVPLMLGWSVVLTALATYLVLRGLGTVDNACDSHPMPTS
jgi:hypothetical protein